MPWKPRWLPDRPETTIARAAVAPAASVPAPHRERLAALWKGFTGGDTPPVPEDGRGVMDLMSRSFDTMQARMTRLQIAQDPPDLLIQVPGDAAMFHEFWRARELVQAGRDAATKALDAAG